jgi:ATP-dependent Clp protease ATP-binding subunit ClpA
VPANISQTQKKKLNPFAMNHLIVDFFIKENAAWDDMITRQKSEIPTLEKMLNKIISEKKNIGEHTLASVSHLQSEMTSQQKNMQNLKEDLAKQQHYLNSNFMSGNGSYDVDSLSRQNILREQIRNVERTFIELKCNYLNYMSLIA